jgi:DNA topoisomerase IA
MTGQPAKEPNDWLNPIKLGFEQLQQMPWYQIQVSKSSSKSKVYLTKEVSHQLRRCGQEGELIQRWVMNEANYKGEVKRLWISSLTTEAIREV